MVFFQSFLDLLVLWGLVPNQSRSLDLLLLLVLVEFISLVGKKEIVLIAEDIMRLISARRRLEPVFVLKLEPESRF